MKAVLGAAVAALLTMGLMGTACRQGDDGAPVLLLGDPPRNWTYEGSDVYVVHVRRGLTEITPGFLNEPAPEGMYPRLTAPGPLPCYVELAPVQTLGFGPGQQTSFRIPVERLERPVVVGFKLDWVPEPTNELFLAGPQECE